MNKKLPNFVPWGLPPFTSRSVEKEVPTLNLIFLFLRNVWTMANDSVDARAPARARMNIEWLRRLRALLKSIERRETAVSGASRAIRIFCQQSIRKWLVPLPFTPPYWFGDGFFSSVNVVAATFFWHSYSLEKIEINKVQILRRSGLSTWKY